MQLMTIITLWLVIAFSYGNYLESNFEFLGHVPTPVSADSASKEVTISHCFSSCIQNNNCYFIDFCDNSISETCYLYERNRTNVIGADDCSGNLVHPATSSYTFRRAFSNDYTHELYCDMVTEGGGWIVFQKRMDGSVDFYRNWNDYTNGFGNLNEYYKGNNALFEIVKDGNFELRIDLEDKSGEWRYAKYFHFSIGGPDTNFTLSVSGYTGNAGEFTSIKYTRM
ncbi:ficolin-1-A-like [Saccostrea cucullata]|uniref:ficolin-1-A-like n=1 Tax=Saccostrea cuccullata TaxID=36930 RepID=UPI002ED01A1B